MSIINGMVHGCPSSVLCTSSGLHYSYESANRKPDSNRRNPGFPLAAFALVPKSRHPTASPLLLFFFNSPLKTKKSPVSKSDYVTSSSLSLFLLYHTRSINIIGPLEPPASTGFLFCKTKASSSIIYSFSRVFAPHPRLSQIAIQSLLPPSPRSHAGPFDPDLLLPTLLCLHLST